MNANIATLPEPRNNAAHLDVIYKQVLPMTRIRQIFIALLPLLMLIGSCGPLPGDDMPDAAASFVDNLFQ